MNYVIMGASSGLGLETARLLVAAGHRVGVAARRTSALEALRQTAPDRIFTATIDVTAPDAPQQLQQLIDRMGGMDVYLHSAGVGYTNLKLDTEKELQTVHTNGIGFTQMICHAYHYFAQHQRRGHIAAITSVAGTKGLAAAPAYSATKRFQYAFLQSLSQMARLHHHDITFTDIRPGFVRTAFIAQQHFPMTMSVEAVAKSIVHALHCRKRVAIIDFRYHLLVALWRLCPNWLWERLPIR